MNSCWCGNKATPHSHVNAFTYFSHDSSHNNIYGAAIQDTVQFNHLIDLLYKLGITVFY